MRSIIEPIGQCHAGPNHRTNAQLHGPFGMLCSDCWAWIERFLARLRGEK